MSEKTAAIPTPPAKGAPRIPRRAWVLVPLLALGMVAATSTLRVQRVRYVSGLAGWSAADRRDASEPWQPQLIVPGNQDSTFEWLDQTRQMLATGELRVRRIDYENAPFGHDVRAASPYRWWLGLLAWICHGVSGQPLGASLETAALLADPLMYALLLAGTAAFVAWRFGRAAAAVVSAALAALYPLAVAFLPGAPDDQGLALAAVLWGVLPLLAGIQSAGRQRLWFLAAGAAGGLGLWAGVSSELPVIAGIGIGGLAAAWVSRGSPGSQTAPPRVLPWGTWAAGGAAVSLAAYLLEYFPSHLGSWEVRAVHPLYGVAWLGWGQLLGAGALRIQGGRPASRLREAGLALLAAAAAGALPTAMWLTHSRGFISADVSLLKLTRLPTGLASKDLLTLVIREGFSPVILATILPVLLAVPAFWLLLRRAEDTGTRCAVAVAMGPVMAALGFALFKLSWWNGFDAALVALLAVVTAALQRGGRPRFIRAGWLALAALALVPGAVQAWPRAETEESNALIEPEIVGLIERDLARWLAVHAPPGGGVVLAPADATTALYYYGGLRGLGTLDLDNQEGIQAVVRIVSATSFDEAFDLVSRRGVNYLVIPSWDSQLDSFARLGLGKLEGSFVHGLHLWALPPWLQPVPYPLPAIGGFEGQSVVVFKVTEDQDDAILMSRMADYMVETGNLNFAASADKVLRRYQANISALVARAQVEMAREETDEFSRTVDAILPRLSGEGEQALPWDRRVNLAVVLAQGHHLDLARRQFQRCLDEVDDEKRRSLSTGSLYHLEVLCRVLGVEIADARLRQVALDLLPPETKGRLGK